MTVCPQCGGKRTVYRTMQSRLDGPTLVLVPCPYEGCPGGIIACDDVPNDGLPKGETDERDTRR